MSGISVVSIHSVSGGGKTALATALHTALPQSALYCFDDFDDSNIYPDDFYEWSLRGGDINEFDAPGMRSAVDEELRKGQAQQILLDCPLGRSHARFRDILSLAVFIDTPLDVAMARRMLRDYAPTTRETSTDTLERLRGELTHYLEKDRFPYLDTYRHKADSDLVLDGCRSIEELKAEVLVCIGVEQGHVT